MELERSSPPSHQEVHEPLHNWDAAPDPHSVPGGEVSWLALCLDTVQTALSALEWEIADAWAATADAQAKTIGKVSFIEKLYPNVNGLVLTIFSVVSPRGGVGRSLRGGLVAIHNVNVGGVLLEDRLWAMLAQVRMVALRGVHHGVALALD